MSLVFQTKPTATLKGKSSTGESISVTGITTASITPARAAEQANKLLGIGEKNIVADKNMTRVQTEEADEE